MKEQQTVQSTEEKGARVGVEAHGARDVAGSIGLRRAARKLDALAHQLGVRGCGRVAHVMKKKRNNSKKREWGDVGKERRGKARAALGTTASNAWKREKEKQGVRPQAYADANLAVHSRAMASNLARSLL